MSSREFQECLYMECNIWEKETARFITNNVQMNSYRIVFLLKPMKFNGLAKCSAPLLTIYLSLLISKCKIVYL